VQNTSTTGTHAVLINNTNASPQNQAQTPNTNPNTSITASQRILFAIQGSKWSLDLEEIPVSSLLNDPAFFRELKVRYKKHRSLIKRLVSPFRFRSCKFVKVTHFPLAVIVVHLLMSTV
jgi:hypothetical protein